MGRREQHKADTRCALERAAHRLFESRGYQATTVRDISEAAGVAERTFFRYFPSKESLVLGQIRALIPELQRSLRARPAEEPPYTALRNALLALGEEYGTVPMILFRGPDARSPEKLSRGDRFLLFDLEQAVSEIFRERLGARPGSDADGTALALRAAVLARASVGALRAVLLVYSELPEAERTEGRVKELTGAAFAALEG